jgi:hypothetical protein
MGVLLMKKALQKDVTAAVNEWSSHSPEVVQCRSWNAHPWDAYTVFATPVRFAEVQRCSNCGIFRRRILSRKTGKLLEGWRPTYYPEYLMPKGQGRIAGEARQILHMAAMEIAIERSSDFRTVGDETLTRDVQVLIEEGLTTS